MTNEKTAQRATKKIVIVAIIFFKYSVSSLFSATYFTMPVSKPKVTTACVEDKKFLKFPTKAIPAGPTNSAINLDVINPIAIFKTILKLFKEAILNKLDRNMTFIFCKIYNKTFSNSSKFDVCIS